MADLADMAEQAEHFAREDAIHRRKRKAPPSTGFCLNCSEPVKPPSRWCDSDCREDWDRRRR